MQFISTLIYSISFVFISVLIALILSNRKTIATILFSITLISLLGWTFSLYLFYQIETPEMVLFLGRLNFAFGVLLAPSIYLFVRSFPLGRKFSKFDFLIIIETIVLTCLTMATQFVVVDEIVDGANRITVFGHGYLFFVIHFFVLLLSSIVILVKKVRNSVGIIRVQNQIFLLGLVSSVVFGGATNILVPVLFSAGIVSSVDAYTAIQNLGAFSTVIFGVPIFISIFRYKFLDTRIIVGRIIYYSAISLTFYVSFNFVAVFYSTFFGSVFSPGALLTGPVVALFFSILFRLFDNYFTKVIDLSFINKDYDPSQVIASFNKNIGEVLDLVRLSEIAYDHINKVFGVDKVALLIRLEKQGGFTEYIEKIEKKKVELLIPDLLKVWDVNGFDPFIADEIELYFPDRLLGVKKSVDRVLSAMVKLGVRVIIPVGQGSQELAGILVLGTKKIDDPYTLRDISFVSTLVTTLDLAIRRSALYVEVQNFNSTLQLKITEATTELAERYDELKRIRERERDMMDIMGHELRTPLSIIKITLGSLKMKAERDPESVKAEAFLKEYPKLDNALKREIELLETMLTSTKIDASKLELNLEDVDMVEVLEDAILGQQEKAQEKGLKVEFKKPKGPVHAYVDKVRVGEVVDNFMSNAVKYTEQGVVKLELNSDEEKVTVRVTDSGQGMPPEALQRLGEKFYRVKQYVTDETGERKEIVRPGGTGLGLYVSFNLVKLMQGTYDIESEVGKGSIFSFTVPKYAGQERAVKGSKGKDLFARMGLR